VTVQPPYFAGFRLWLSAVVALVLLGCLTLVPNVGAATVSLTGAVRGDSNARVSMKIVLRGGQPKFVKRFMVKRLDHRCTDGVAREYSRTFPGRIKLNKLLTGRYVFFASILTRSTPPLAPGGYFVSGATRRSARRVTNGNISSTIRFPSDLPSGETACTAGGKFSASR